MLGRTLLVTGISLRSDQKASDNTCDMFGVQVAKTAGAHTQKTLKPMIVRLSFEKASPRISNTTTKHGLSKDRRYGSILAFGADHVA